MLDRRNRQLVADAKLVAKSLKRQSPCNLKRSLCAGPCQVGFALGGLGRTLKTRIERNSLRKSYIVRGRSSVLGHHLLTRLANSGVTLSL